MGKSIVREAGFKYDRGIVVGQESHHIARTAGPPAVRERNVAVENVVAV